MEAKDALLLRPVIDADDIVGLQARATESASALLCSFFKASSVTALHFCLPFSDEWFPFMLVDCLAVGSFVVWASCAAFASDLPDGLTFESGGGAGLKECRM